MGGNVFKDKTQSIELQNIEITVQKYLEELKVVFPGKKEIFTKKNFKYLGSVGKKAVSGDIDFAIDISSIVDKRFSDKSIQKWGLNPEEVKEQFKAFKKRARTATDAEIMTRAILKGIVTKINANAENLYCDEKKITPGNIFGLFPQYTPEGDKLDYGVQIDWMIGNMDWLEFSYYSESYEGNIKGLHRTQLMLSMFQYLNMSFNHIKGVTDKKTKSIVASNPTEALVILSKGFNAEITKEISSNYFSLIKIVNLMEKNNRDEILNIYFNILSRTRADIPFDLQEDWKRMTILNSYQTKFLPKDSLLLQTFNEDNGELNYLNNGNKLSIWWNAAEDILEYQIITDDGNSSYQDDFCEPTNTIMDLKIFNKEIKRIANYYEIKLPEMSNKNYNYLYA